MIMSTAMMRAGVKVKGLEWLIESCDRLQRKGHDFSLVIIGDGPQKQRIQALAQETLGDRGRFLGLIKRSELAEVFSAGDCFAFPGLEESVGMVYLEAQACGLPAVATSDEGAPFVIKDGVSGLVTDVSIDDFTQGIERLLVDTDYRTKLGEQAVEYVQQHDAATTYQTMNETMQSIVKRT